MDARNTAYTIQRQLDSRRATQRWQEKEPMTPKEIESMEAGRELDALIHKALRPRHNVETEILRFQYCDGEHEKGTACEWKEIPHYSTNIADAWEVVEKLRSSNFTHLDLRLHNGRWGMVGYYDMSSDDFRHTVWADTAPLAICRAALLAVNQEAK